MDHRKLSTQKNYSQIADLYTKDFGTDNEHFNIFVDRVIELIREKKLSGMIVDLGSGPGNVIDYLLEKSVLNPLVAVDFTPEFCSVLNEKYAGNAQISNKCEDFVSLVFNQENESIAAYIANYSIIHVLDEELDEFFSNVYRSLEKGGVFAFSVWKGTKKDMQKEPYQVQNDKRLIAKEQLESYLNNFTEEELEQRLTQARLSIIQMKTFEPTNLPGEFSQPKIWVLAERK